MPEPETEKFQFAFSSPEPLLQPMVAHLLLHHGLNDCQIHAGNTAPAPVIFLPDYTVCRLGAFLDYIIDNKRKILAKSFSEIPVGQYVLRSESSALFDASIPDAPPIRLTEKEVALLMALAQAGAQGLNKDALLARIWGHQAVLETHTLETHIYRLRQKIEADAKNPEILLTIENGYCLANRN
ncbi:MAG: helix-turn-helix domain-containing protein [Alphaproteobacteria bacterium]|nr:helix-turn-helix domain-containing protein [Alphaproteobacteria bacterium]